MVFGYFFATLGIVTFVVSLYESIMSKRKGFPFTKQKKLMLLVVAPLIFFIPGILEFIPYERDVDKFVEMSDEVERIMKHWGR